jgi:hypothetical protein
VANHRLHRLAASLSRAHVSGAVTVGSGKPTFMPLVTAFASLTNRRGRSPPCEPGGARYVVLTPVCRNANHADVRIVVRRQVTVGNANSYHRQQGERVVPRENREIVL